MPEVDKERITATGPSGSLKVGQGGRHSIGVDGDWGGTSCQIEMRLSKNSAWVDMPGVEAKTANFVILALDLAYGTRIRANLTGGSDIDLWLRVKVH